MVLVTLIGDSHAHIGNRFYYMGPNDECKECRLKNVCLNLETGSLYEIVQLRDTEHECTLRESNVRVVVVEKVAFQAAVPKKLAMDGSMITFESRKCDNLGCPNKRFCDPSNLTDGDKRSITEVLEKLECPKGENLVRVKME
ncbi:MAG: UPF0179 family protein [Candidatus Methanomethylophilaceae archaeon]|nr:UPF0179 family protein [Candidatus Methanomethylophilaceae archaeon]